MAASVQCLWKMVRMLPDMINELNLDRVLADLHLFLRAFPGYTWKQRPTDMPLRTVKTLLHTFAKLKGQKVRYSSVKLSENKGPLLLGLDPS